MPVTVKRFTLDIDPEKYADLIQLAEEKRIGKLVDQAIALFHTALLHSTKGFRVGLIPVTEDGKQDFKRGITFLNIANL